MGYFDTVCRKGEGKEGGRNGSKGGLGSNKCDSDMIVGKDAWSEILEMVYPEKGWKEKIVMEGGRKTKLSNCFERERKEGKNERNRFMGFLTGGVRVSATT